MCFCGFIAEKSIKGQNRAVIELCDHVIIVIFVIISYCYEIPARNKRMTGNTEHYKTNTILRGLITQFLDDLSVVVVAQVQILDTTNFCLREN